MMFYITYIVSMLYMISRNIDKLIILYINGDIHYNKNMKELTICTDGIKYGLDMPWTLYVPLIVNGSAISRYHKFVNLQYQPVYTILSKYWIINDVYNLCQNHIYNKYKLDYIK
jgi:hypothetical protein